MSTVEKGYDDLLKAQNKANKTLRVNNYHVQSDIPCCEHCAMSHQDSIEDDMVCGECSENEHCIVGVVQPMGICDKFIKPVKPIK